MWCAGTITRCREAAWSSPWWELPTTVRAIDAVVLRPLLDTFEGIVVANGICPRYSDIDTYHMTACAIDEAVRNAISAGGSLGRNGGHRQFLLVRSPGIEEDPRWAL